jgi:hypothetical protein
MKAKKPKRPVDPMELAKLIGDMATGQSPRDDEALKEAKHAEHSQPISSVSRKSHPSSKRDT